MSKKVIMVEEFARELARRLEINKDINCCKEEILNLMDIVTKKIPQEKIEVNWKD
ncbi:hypothetical protein [Salinispira pacifica]|uniref:Uncharacterized protein n=1 Tax=Salinispira pacifica TaxID=1307761 RepID=V5WJ32_9SPIO|nr:hypothetical protein [Salinispira pacifica]AHC15798.1 hypothetical protein L21SP2_2445 [Salinispira pacifica]